MHYFSDLFVLKNSTYLSEINLRNSASRCLLLSEYITMHGPLNVKSFIYAFVWTAEWELPTFAVVKKHFINVWWECLLWACDGSVYCERVMGVFTVSVWWECLLWACDGSVYCERVMGVFTVSVWWECLLWACDGNVYCEREVVSLFFCFV
jgi:hypothetical protein